MLRNWRTIAKRVLKTQDEAKKKIGEKEILTTLFKLQILSKSPKLDDVLAVTVPQILERRLQTQVYKQGMANTVKQARQFIVHNKTFVNGKVISSPSYLVREDDKINLSASLKLVKGK